MRREHGRHDFLLLRPAPASSADRSTALKHLISGAFWLDVRRAQHPSRPFGEAATAAWVASRQSVRLRAEDPRAAESATHQVAAWLLAEHVASFHFGSAHGGAPTD